KIDSLTAVSRQDEKLDINIDEEVHRLREKSVELTRKIFADLGDASGALGITAPVLPLAARDNITSLDLTSTAVTSTQNYSDYGLL
ncbi:hypothetical protein MJM04_33710, partial [Salmonella enterica subsp. enterica serovar Cerro]|nr:hypothetical protein [Salmonella enterica subsp. enterica serovar Cerro]